VAWRSAPPRPFVHTLERAQGGAGKTPGCREGDVVMGSNEHAGRHDPGGESGTVLDLLHGRRPAAREEALVPAFIIEELEDRRFTVVVPSIPTPLAGAVYVLSRERVHPLDVPFTQAIQTVSRWWSGAKELVAAMQQHSR
jgi:hypothetical protein